MPKAKRMSIDLIFKTFHLNYRFLLIIIVVIIVMSLRLSSSARRPPPLHRS